MSQKPDFSPDTSGPYLRPRVIPKRPDAGAGSSSTATTAATATATVTSPEPEAGIHQPQDFRPPAASAERSKLWFEETVAVPDAFRELLVEYSHIPPGQVDDYVVQIRNRAWKVHPYPCLGQFRFLELNLASRPGDLYPRLLSILKDTDASSSSSSSSSADSGTGVLFLDVGTCLGQDIRKLVHDGAPSSTVAGAELSSTFIGLGYELFHDSPEEVLMLQANILSPISSASLQWFRGKLKVVQLGMILHLFTWEEQITAFVNAISLLRDEKGVLIIGQATGNVDGATTHTLTVGGGNRATWKHNVDTFNKLVRDIEERTGTRWEVKSELDEGLSVNDGKRTWDDPRTRRLLFELERR